LPQAKASGYKQRYPAACGGEDSFFVVYLENIMNLKLSLFAVLLFFSACAGGGSGKDNITDDTGIDITETSGDLSDTKEVSPDLIFNDDGIAEITPEIEEVNACNKPPKPDGCSCSKNSECESLVCLESQNGSICSSLCGSGEQCPENTSCMEIQVDGNTVKVCVPLFKHLCMPCYENKDCYPESMCVSFGNSGMFCSQECSETVKCPADYQCGDQQISAEKTIKICKPSAGECKCSDNAVKLGLTTKCFKENSSGKCEGIRECTKDGLTECDAAEPKQEECNKKDDNCDGFVDEGLIDCCKCGNKICEVFCGETMGTCSIDCFTCGNAKCEPGEGPFICPMDCCGKCGDQKCAIFGSCTETKDTCPSDCAGFACGNSACDKGENPFNCPEDCTKFACGNNICEPGEDPSSCAVDCDKACGNCLCEGGESFDSCPVDCGYCGDGYCSPCFYLKENINTCHADCCTPATEVCNGKDDNCNDIIDEEGSEGCDFYFVDADGDGFGGTKKKCLCAPDEFYKADNSSDCDDTNSSVNPSAPENCGTSFDDNCNNDTNDLNASLCITGYLDEDEDGFGTSASECRCEPAGKYTALKSGDCNDMNKDINPDAQETCQTNYDDNCDGSANDLWATGCIEFFYDNDGDNFGTSDFECRCDMDGKYKAPEPNDCDDTNSFINPNQQELCNNEVDENCDGSTNDENALGCTIFYYDRDEDTYGTTDSRCLCKKEGFYTASKTGDCDDKNSSVNPAAEEICGTDYDDDCDNNKNENGAKGCKDFYIDADKDGWGISSKLCLCYPENDYTAEKTGDCLDTNADVNPSIIESTGEGNCQNSLDDDCDKLTDFNDPDC
jgi:hypothetical protein